MSKPKFCASCVDANEHGNSPSSVKMLQVVRMVIADLQVEMDVKLS